VNVFIAIFGLALLVFVHEAGHFFAALSVGMSPRKFYIGFPPALVKRKRKGVEYGIGAIPLGGYVKIPGMHRPAASDVDAHFAPARSERPELTVPIERLRRALDDGDEIGARAELNALEDALTTVELSPAAAHSAGRGVRELEDMLGPDAYWRQPAYKRIIAIAAGPVTNIIFALILFTALFLVSGGAATSQIQTVRGDFPAAAAGLQPGDEILAIGEQQVSPDTIGTTINDSKGKPVKIIVARKGEGLVELGPVKAKKDPQSDRYLIGIVLDREGLSVPGAAWNSIRLTGLVTKQIGVSLSQLVTGKGHDDISSPVGIVKGSSTALDEGTENYLWVLGLLSLSLALLNLLPLLPLDGGHILFSAIEGIRGRAVGRRVYERVSAIGLAVVLLLFFVGLTNDIGNLGS
jgi:regulator of sigma E protease